MSICVVSCSGMKWFPEAVTAPRMRWITVRTTAGKPSGAAVPASAAMPDDPVFSATAVEGAASGTDGGA